MNRYSVKPIDITFKNEVPVACNGLSRKYILSVHITHKTPVYDVAASKREIILSKNPQDNFLYVSEKQLNDLYHVNQCCVCFCLMKNPYQNSKCGHIFCHYCLLETISKYGRCAQCQMPTTKRKIKPHTTMSSIKSILFPIHEDAENFQEYYSDKIPNKVVSHSKNKPLDNHDTTNINTNLDVINPINPSSFNLEFLKNKREFPNDLSNYYNKLHDTNNKNNVEEKCVKADKEKVELLKQIDCYYYKIHISFNYPYEVYSDINEIISSSNSTDMAISKMIKLDNHFHQFNKLFDSITIVQNSFQTIGNLINYIKHKLFLDVNYEYDFNKISLKKQNVLIQNKNKEILLVNNNENKENGNNSNIRNNASSHYNSSYIGNNLSLVSNNIKLEEGQFIVLNKTFDNESIKNLTFNLLYLIKKSFFKDYNDISNPMLFSKLANDYINKLNYKFRDDSNQNMNQNDMFDLINKDLSSNDEVIFLEFELQPN